MYSWMQHRFETVQKFHSKTQSCRRMFSPCPQPATKRRDSILMVRKRFHPSSHRTTHSTSVQGVWVGAGVCGHCVSVSLCCKRSLRAFRGRAFCKRSLCALSLGTLCAQALFVRWFACCLVFPAVVVGSLVSGCCVFELGAELLRGIGSSWC